MNDFAQFVASTLAIVALVASGIALGGFILIGAFHAIVDIFGERG